MSRGGHTNSGNNYSQLHKGKGDIRRTGPKDDHASSVDRGKRSLFLVGEAQMLMDCCLQIVNRRMKIQTDVVVVTTTRKLSVSVTSVCPPIK